MAFNSVLHRASIFVLPLAVPAVGFPRAFHKAIPSVLCVRKHSITLSISHRSSIPSSRFVTNAAGSSSVDKNLVRVLESEIDCGEKPVHESNFPARFPFEIHDTPGERIVTLSRRFQDEIIKVEVDMPNLGEVEDEYEEEDNGGDQDTEDLSGSSLPLVVKVTKQDGEYLEFGITAFSDEIAIDSLSVRNPKNDEDELAYEGPDFDDLDENLQKAFYKYLDVRGINPGTANLLFEYMTKKDSSEYLHWLQSIKNFVEK